MRGAVMPSVAQHGLAVGGVSASHGIAGSGAISDYGLCDGKGCADPAEEG